ncbi:DUF1287 domain-containing protein [Frigoriflavimonas asaccharolytica]|uniref:DUF1287 domain-containing protein n=1 Tax=Frigoriflavimonas asaccharolytica TaxID=2735899 RepID=A0A8J8GA65_9FLAO|nr:DUF1287 domain-containing protein [Frigoriflavimonas asaccharolytica]NRS92185.1 hypothetical protein [Frigoriflavimonas asaccharolytica]
MKTKFFVLLIFSFSLLAKSQKPFALQLSDTALELTKDKVNYDPTYFVLKYPNGDIPTDKGVCTDVVIRAYRKLGIDLQKEVHEDMAKNFSKYPKYWGLKKPDTNIDHRRVPNLRTFFSRYGKVIPPTLNAEDYVPGDIITWVLPKNLTHIGIVINKKSADGKRFLVVHNIGNGQEISDCLFDFTITGHYQYQK